MTLNSSKTTASPGRVPVAYSLLNDDCLNAFKAIESSSIDLIVTDPPYFLDGLDDVWDKDKIDDSTKKAGLIGSMPVGMKFDPKQGIKFQEFMKKVSEEAFRILKPGAFYISFSQARLYHRLAIAAEDSGFEIRDMLGWVYNGQAKAFSQTHFVQKSKKYTQEEKIKILASLQNRKTPQLKPCIEPMILAQKPKEGTFVENWIAHGVGLVDFTQSLNGGCPGNLMAVSKPSKKEKGDYNTHLTVKPITLITHIIKLFSTEGQLICDPFCGSGSHGVAALNANRNFIGIEKNKDHFNIATTRLKEATRD